LTSPFKHLAPALLSDATPEMVAKETRAVLETMRGPQGPCFQPWPRRAAQCEIGKYRRPGRNGEKFQMNGGVERFVAVDVSPRILFSGGLAPTDVGGYIQLA